MNCMAETCQGLDMIYTDYPLGKSSDMSYIMATNWNQTRTLEDMGHSKEQSNASIERAAEDISHIYGKWGSRISQS